MLAYTYFRQRSPIVTDYVLQEEADCSSAVAGLPLQCGDAARGVSVSPLSSLLTTPYMKSRPM